MQRGDTLNAIAARFSKEEAHHVTVEAIVAANGITDPARIEVGEQFFIPVVITYDQQSPAPEPTATQWIQPPPGPVSQSVKEGCIGATILQGALEEENIGVLETFGEGAMINMVSTDDAGLTMVGGIIALEMVDYGANPTDQSFKQLLGASTSISRPAKRS